jgi:hypothetical protein
MFATALGAPSAPSASSQASTAQSASTPAAAPDELDYGRIELPPLAEAYTESQPHRHRDREPDVPVTFSLITRQLSKKDKEWQTPKGQAAIFDEISNLVNKGVLASTVRERDAVVAELGADCHFAALMIILGIKFSELGESQWKFKARCVLRGDDVRSSDGSPAFFSDTGSSPTTMETVRSVALFSAMCGDEATAADAVAAYLQCPLRPEDGPPTFVAFNKQDCSEGSPWLKIYPQIASMRRPVVRLQKALYGHPKAGALWEQFLDRTLLSLGWYRLQSQTYGMILDGDAAVDLSTVREGDIEGLVEKSNAVPASRRSHLIFTAYVDDMVMGGKSRHQQLQWKLLRQHIQAEDPQPLDRMLGVKFSTERKAKGGFTIAQSMEQYTLQACEKYVALCNNVNLPRVDTPMVDISVSAVDDDDQPGKLTDNAASLLMTVLFLARMVRADCLYTVNVLARDVTRWHRRHDRALHRLFCYLKHTAKLQLIYEVGCGVRETEMLVLEAYPDADHGGCPSTARSTSGGALKATSLMTTATLCWHSKRQTCTSHSTAESEIVSLDKMLRDIAVPAQQFWSFACGRLVTVKVHEDNQAAIRIIQSGYSLAMRHLQKTHRINLAVVSEIIRTAGFELHYIESSEQVGDFLTKPLDKVKLQAALLMVGLFLRTS